MKKNLVPAIASISWDRTLTTEELTPYVKRSCHKISKKEMVKRILSFMKNNNITELDRKIFNKILGDSKILNKLQICTDGSYVNGRIFFKNFYNKANTNILVDGEYWMQYYKKYEVSLDMLSKLNYMKHNFEVIYLHLVQDKESWDDKLWQDEFDNMMPDFYEPDYVYYEESIG